MKLKTRPSDFVVKESLVWTPDADGNYYVYRVHKRGLSTLDAVAAIAKGCGLPETRISFAGLKDKRAETEQLISVEGQPFQADVRGVQLEFLGRSRSPITSERSVANSFQIIVRDLSKAEVERLPQNLEAVQRWGLPNYFDDQRFGCVRFGEGFIVKDLLLGKVEQCLRRYLTAVSTFDSREEKTRKQFIADNWGHWDALARRDRRGNLHVLFMHLLRRPGDFRSAFRYLDPRLFSLHLFAYQSFIWNESAARFLAMLCPSVALLRIPHVTGPLPVHARLADETFSSLKFLQFPLISHKTVFSDDRIAAAVTEVLAKEGLTLEGFRIKKVSRKFFRDEPRPFLLFPADLRVGKPERDELHGGRQMARVSFSLPPGCYGTLVVKRLFPEKPNIQGDNEADAERRTDRGRR